MSGDPVLVYLHGVGGARPGWARHLLTDQIPATARIIAPTYVSILRAAEPVVDSIVRSPARLIDGLDQARRYIRDPDVRDRVLHQVRTSVDPLLCTSGPVVIIGHSLGAVVALDLLAATKQPIEQLITVGAPLGHPDISGRLVDRGIDTTRIGGWINVVHPLDPVALGRRAHELFPFARDVQLSVFNRTHGLAGFGRDLAHAVTAHLDGTYLSSDVVRETTAGVLAGTPRVRVG